MTISSRTWNRITIRCSVSISPSSTNGSKVMPQPQENSGIPPRGYDRLRAEAGYTGGYSSVKRYVRKKRFVLRQGLAGCLPLAHPMAHAQVDFGEFLRCDADGNEHKAYELVMSFPYSDKAYA